MQHISCVSYLRQRIQLPMSNPQPAAIVEVNTRNDPRSRYAAVKKGMRDLFANNPE